MPDLFDNDGNPVEAFTTEEVDKKIEDALKTTKEEGVKTVEEVQEKLKIAEKDKKDLEEKNKKPDDDKGDDDKDKNWAKVREMMKTKDTEIVDLKKDLLEFKEGVSVQFSQKKVEDAIGALAGDNKELVDKIKFHFDSFKIDTEIEKDPAKKEEAFKARIGNAYTLATGGQPPALGGTDASGKDGFVPPPPAGGKGTQLSPEAEQLGKKKLGITEEEIKTAKEKKLI